MQTNHTNKTDLTLFKSLEIKNRISIGKGEVEKKCAKGNWKYRNCFIIICFAEIINKYNWKSDLLTGQ